MPPSAPSIVAAPVSAATAEPKNTNEIADHGTANSQIATAPRKARDGDGRPAQAACSPGINAASAADFKAGGKS